MVEKSSRNLDVTCFQTSIWDETLYEAWSAIVYSLIPNISRIESNLKIFCELCNADEVVLFEKSHIFGHQSLRQQRYHDRHRFEKVSNIIKQFKLSCSKMQFAPGTLGGGGGVSELQVENSKFNALVTEFTTNTFIMVVTSSNAVPGTAIKTNIQAVKKKFELFIAESVHQPPAVSVAAARAEDSADGADEKDKNGEETSATTADDAESQGKDTTTVATGENHEKNKCVYFFVFCFCLPTTRARKCLCLSSCI